MTQPGPQPCAGHFGLELEVFRIMPPKKKQKVEAVAEEKAEADVQVARVCQPAPEFEAMACMSDGSLKKVALSEHQGKWVVLFFYPLDWTFVCPTEIIAFSDKAKDFQKINCEVWGASVDSHYSHLAWTQQDRKRGGLGKINIPLISDLSHSISAKYGVLLPDGHACRATFIIDPKGVIRHLSMNDPPVGRNVDEVYRLVTGYQFTDKHGEVCPAGWYAGGKTIKPDPKDKLEFFEAVN
eukprot:g36.t1